MNLLSQNLLRSTRGIVLTAAGLALGAGCNNSSRPNSFIIAADADPETQVSTLDDDQLRDICEGYSGYVEAEVSFDTLARAACLPFAILSTFTADTCEEVYAECTASAPSPLQIRAEIEGDAACTQSLRSCDATVAELEGCVNLQLDALNVVLDRLACGSDSRDMAAELMTDLSTCANVDSRCTEFTQTGVLQ